MLLGVGIWGFRFFLSFLADVVGSKRGGVMCCKRAPEGFGGSSSVTPYIVPFCEFEIQVSKNPIGGGFESCIAP